MDDRHHELQLAQESFPRLSELAAALACDTVNPRLGDLGGHLCIFAEESAHFSDGHKRRLVRDGKIQELLSAVETVLSGETATKAKQGYPILRALTEAVRSTNETASGQVRPSLRSVEKRIQVALSTWPGDFRGVVTLLSDCSESNTENKPDELLPPGHGTLGEDEPSRYAEQAESLCRILARYYDRCICVPKDEQGHWARLRLKPVCEMDEGDHILMDMLFSASPNPAKTRLFEWQEARIRVSTRDLSGRRVRLEPEGRSQVRENHSKDSDSEPVESLCTLITTKCGAPLHFKTSNQSLRVCRQPLPFDMQRPVIQPSPGLHLGDILDNYNMRYGMRPVLAYILCRAVWNHYDSDWIRASMTSNSILFMAELLDEEVAYFCKPYLSTRPQSREGQSPECRQIVGMMHQYPRILALGIMLAEIGTGRRINLEDQPPDYWTPRTANSQLVMLGKYVDKADFLGDCSFPCYKTAVKKCLDPLLFKDARYNPQKPDENLERRRTILYDEVVDPLRRLIEGTGWHLELDELQRTALTSKRGAAPLGRQPKITLPSRARNPDAAAAGTTKSDSWLERATIINDWLKEERKKSQPTGRRIKIALLDTGYDPSVPWFDLPGAGSQIKAWRDFAAGSLEPVDTDGHGTYLLTLLLQLGCPADIFVARITDSSQCLRQAEQSVSAAIRTAASEWEVDFISMSFGFPEHVPDIEAAIVDAVRARDGALTIFAAANNDGRNSREMFPANMGGSVIPVRATDRMGGFEPAFDPPASSDELLFGTLGYDIVSDWPGEDLGRSMSGCSVATPLAAAIAVMLLEYAASRPRDFSPPDLRLMRTRRGVYELFKEIGVPSGNQRYYLSPWDLFRNSKEDVRLAKIKAALGRVPERW